MSKREMLAVESETKKRFDRLKDGRTQTYFIERLLDLWSAINATDRAFKIAEWQDKKGES